MRSLKMINSHDKRLPVFLDELLKKYKNEGVVDGSPEENLKVITAALDKIKLLDPAKVPAVLGVFPEVTNIAPDGAVNMEFHIYTVGDINVLLEAVFALLDVINRSGLGALTMKHVQERLDKGESLIYVPGGKKNADPT
jgi:hypothetical protein